MGNPLGLGNLYWYNLFSWVPQIQDFGGSFSLPSVDGHGFLARQAANSSGYPEEQPQVPSHVGAHELRSWDARGREGLGWALSGWGHLWWPARKMMETGTRRPEELKRAEEKWSRERPSGRLSFFFVSGFEVRLRLEMAWNGLKWGRFKPEKGRTLGRRFALQQLSLAEAPKNHQAGSNRSINRDRSSLPQEGSESKTGPQISEKDIISQTWTSRLLVVKYSTPQNDRKAKSNLDSDKLYFSKRLKVWHGVMVFGLPHQLFGNHRITGR